MLDSKYIAGPERLWLLAKELEDHIVVAPKFARALYVDIEAVTPFRREIQGTTLHEGMRSRWDGVEWPAGAKLRTAVLKSTEILIKEIEGQSFTWIGVNDVERWPCPHDVLVTLARHLFPVQGRKILTITIDENGTEAPGWPWVRNNVLAKPKRPARKVIEFPG